MVGGDESNSFPREGFGSGEPDLYIMVIALHAFNPKSLMDLSVLLPAGSIGYSR